jgi:hypothetical protein
VPFFSEEQFFFGTKLSRFSSLTYGSIDTLPVCVAGQTGVKKSTPVSVSRTPAVMYRVCVTLVNE